MGLQTYWQDSNYNLQATDIPLPSHCINLPAGKGLRLPRRPRGFCQSAVAANAHTRAPVNAKAWMTARRVREPADGLALWAVDTRLRTSHRHAGIQLMVAKRGRPGYGSLDGSLPQKTGHFPR